MQTSLTLTQEVAENCTFVIPGFHKVIRQWWVEVVARDKLAIADYGNNCLKTKSVYLVADKVKYGDFVPAICGPEDIRILWSEILHGSTSNKDGKADNAHWVVNPWFVSIQSDHEITDIPESGTWSSLAANHRDFVAPKNTPSGQANTHDFPLQRFPASVPLRHISHLSDALIGLARWDDPLVQCEVAILLGDDEQASRTFIDKCRNRMAEAYKSNMIIIRDLEMIHYGDNSYYRLVENGRYHPPQFEGDYSGREDVDVE